MREVLFAVGTMVALWVVYFIGHLSNAFWREEMERAKREDDEAGW